MAQKQRHPRDTCLCTGTSRWRDAFVDIHLRTRRVTESDLIVTDRHDGLLVVVSALFTASPRSCINSAMS